MEPGHTHMVRSMFCSLVKLNWKTGVFLIMGLGIPRFYFVLRANVTGNYQYISLIFLGMIILPFLLLNRNGRRAIGFRRVGVRQMLLTFLSGAALALLMYVVGHRLHGTSVHNWYVYIGQSFQNPTAAAIESKLVFFLMFALVGMTFSPVGEEFFYRGLVHQCFRDTFPGWKATIVDSAAFAITHLAHFGIIWVAGKWLFAAGPALLWLIFMFATSQLFHYAKWKTGSVYAAVAGHAGFNLAMTYAIIYWLL